MIYLPARRLRAARVKIWCSEDPIHLLALCSRRLAAPQRGQRWRHLLARLLLHAQRFLQEPHHHVEHVGKRERPRRRQPRRRGYVHPHGNSKCEAPRSSTAVTGRQGKGGAVTQCGPRKASGRRRVLLRDRARRSRRTTRKTRATAALRSWKRNRQEIASYALDLQRHPDGGFYLETFRDPFISLPKSALPPRCKLGSSLTRCISLGSFIGKSSARPPRRALTRCLSGARIRRRGRRRRS
jgi:hypothetical protein